MSAHTPAPRPRVSVVVNCYDGERFLAEALESVIAQTFTEWELLLWDDDSQDRSVEIFRSYRDERFRLVRASHHVSLGEARRAAVAASSGEWIAFLDQDDVWTPDKLAGQLALIDEDGGVDLGFVYGRARTFDERGREWEYDDRYEFSPLPEGHIADDLLLRSGIICWSTYMMRRDAYDAVGGVPAGRYPIAADYYLYVALAQRYRGRALQAPCCRYRIHDSNLFQLRRIEAYEECLAVLDELGGTLAPGDLRARRRSFHTRIGFEQIRGQRRLGAGLGRILRHGSLGFLLTRPLARGARRVRRALHGGRRAMATRRLGRGRR